MKSTTDADKELEGFLKNAGIELTERQKELLNRSSSYAHRLIANGATSWPVGIPLIHKATAKPAAKTSTT